MLTHVTPSRTLPHHVRKPRRLTSPPHLLSLHPARHVTPLAHWGTTVCKSSYHVTPRYTLPRLGQSFVSLPTSRICLIPPSRFGMLRANGSCLALSANPVERCAVLLGAREHGLRGKRADTLSMFYVPTGNWTTHDDDAGISPFLPTFVCMHLEPPDPTFAQTGSGTTRGQAPRFARTLSTRRRPPPT